MTANKISFYQKACDELCFLFPKILIEPTECQKQFCAEKLMVGMVKAQSKSVLPRKDIKSISL